jgi:hypothetical protein
MMLLLTWTLLLVNDDVDDADDVNDVNDADADDVDDERKRRRSSIEEEKRSRLDCQTAINLEDRWY